MGRKSEDLIGKKFNMLTVLDNAENRVRNNKTIPMIICQCDCGNIGTYIKSDVKSGHTKYCNNPIHRRRDYTGQRFGKLTVMGPAEDIDGVQMLWCQCDCGNKKVINKDNVIRGKSKSCGCEIGKSAKNRFIKDISGQRFGYLVAIEQDATANKVGAYWKCKCDCGNYVTVAKKSLLNGLTKSCGCYKSKISSEMFSNKLEGKKFGRLLVLRRAGTEVGTDGSKYATWECVCDCGRHKVVKGANLTANKVRSCGCLTSIKEEEIIRILTNQNIRFITQYKFLDLKYIRPLRFDFAILNEYGGVSCLIEYQGEQHLYTRRADDYFGKQQREITDVMKKEYCANHKIPLYEIWFSDNLEEKLLEILSSI